MPSSSSTLPHLIPIRLPFQVRIGVSRICVTWKENNRGCVIEFDADFGPLTERRDRRVEVDFGNATVCYCQNEQTDDETAAIYDWSELPDAGNTAEEFHAWQELYRQSWVRDGLALDSGIYRVIEPVPKVDARYTRYLVAGHDCYLDIWAQGFDWKELYSLDGGECLTVSDEMTKIVGM